MPAVAERVAGGLQSYGILSPVSGVSEDLPSILLKDAFSIDGDSTVDVFYNRGMVERVTKRLLEFTQTLPDDVLLIDQFRKKDQTSKLMLGTKRDLAYRDAANNRLVYVTPKYSTGVIMVTNADAKIYGGRLVDDCDDDPVAWVDDTGGQVTVTRETTTVKENSVAVKLAFAAGAGTGLVAHHQLGAAINLTAEDSVGFWINCSVALNAGDLKILLDDTGACTSPIESINIPAVSANTWTWINVALADPSLLTAVLSVGINQVVDKGAMNLFLDFIVAGDWAGQFKANDFVTIGTTYSTDDTWYIVSAVNSDTQITLTVVYAGSTAYQQAYQGRRTYTGTATDYWQSVTFNGTDEWLATNGVDNIQVYTGSGQAADLTGSPPKARAITVYENYVVVGDVTSGGNRFPQRYQWPNLATTTGWATGDSGSADIDGTGVLKAFAKHQGFLLILSERAIDKAWLTTETTVFNKKRVVDGIGCDAAKSVIERNEGVFFHASDNTFRFYNGFSWPVISNNFKPTLRNLHPDYEPNIQGIFNEEFQLCCWAVPLQTSTGRLNQVLIYDPLEKTWGMVNVEVSAFGRYEQETTYTWNTLPFSTWDTWAWERWDSRFGFANAPIQLMGAYDQKVYRFFGAELDNGSTYTGKVAFDTDLGAKKSPHLRKRLLYVDVIAMREGTGTMTINVSPDYAGYSQIGTVSLDGTGSTLKQRIACDVSFKNALVQATCPAHFQLVGFVFYYVLVGYR